MKQENLRGDKMILFKGEYKVVWSCNAQTYFVYHSIRGLIDKKYKFSDLKFYL